MKKLFFILLIFIAFKGFSQENSLDKKWLAYLELLGNGKDYSLNVEHLIDKGNHLTGDRFGLTINFGGIISYGNWTMLYERNYIFGRKKFKPEFGIGSSLVYYPKQGINQSNIPGFSNPQSDGYNYQLEVLLTARAGVRYISDKRFNARLGVVPIMFLTCIDDWNHYGFDSNITGFVPFFGLSIGWMLN